MDTIARALLDKVRAQVQRLTPAPRPFMPPRPEAISTGFPALDEALGCAGVPRGYVTELAGQPTAGAHTVALQVLAEAQSAGNLVAYIDLGAGFDAAYAEACGVSMAELMLVRPRLPTDALPTIQMLALGGAGVVVVDSLAELAGFSRPGLSWWSLMRRLRPALDETSCALLALSTRYPQTEPSLASVRLTFRRRQWLMEGGRMAGFETRVLVHKSPFSSRPRQLNLTVPLTGALSGL